MWKDFSSGSLTVSVTVTLLRLEAVEKSNGAEPLQTTAFSPKHKPRPRSVPRPQTPIRTLLYWSADSSYYVHG